MGTADDAATGDCAVGDVLVAYALGDISAHLVPEAAYQAKSSLIDTIGVALAARRGDLVGVLERTHPGNDLAPGALIWTRGTRTDAETAAMINGASAHALDFDDANESIRGHLGSTLWPTILALAECEGSSGRKMIEAYVVGVRTAVAVADGMVIDAHYAKGWHSTSTVGVLAATCAASRLLGLGRGQARNALGIAGSMASGSRQNFGTMTKPFHAGLAARNAVLAARLARAGLGASQTMLEGPLGYYALFQGRERMAQAAASLRQPWTPSRHGVSMKRYAVCYNLQRICEAVVSICADRQISPDDVKRVVVTIEPEGKAPLIHSRPKTGLECKFSAEYVVAALIAGRGLSPVDFDDTVLEDEGIRSLMSRVKLSESDIPPIGPRDWVEGYGTVCLELSTGGTLSGRVDMPKGHWGAPFTRQELSDKFTSCALLGFPGSNPSELESELWSIDTVERFGGPTELVRIARSPLS